MNEDNLIKVLLIAILGCVFGSFVGFAIGNIISAFM